MQEVPHMAPKHWCSSLLLQSVSTHLIQFRAGVHALIECSNIWLSSFPYLLTIIACLLVLEWTLSGWFRQLNGLWVNFWSSLWDYCQHCLLFIHQPDLPKTAKLCEKVSKEGTFKYIIFKSSKWDTDLSKTKCHLSLELQPSGCNYRTLSRTLVSLNLFFLVRLTLMHSRLWHEPSSWHNHCSHYLPLLIGS